jgi:orotidine-5'-phosphate decarboxylase
MNFADRLANAIREKGSYVCVGIDPRVRGLPPTLRPDSCGRIGEDRGCVQAAVERFCGDIIEAVAPYAACVKPQSALFEALGAGGTELMWRLAAKAQGLGLPVIIDAKRNDIGSTAEAYAEAFFRGETRADALTVNPYLGTDGVKPFVDAADKIGAGLFVLVKTSNPSSRELQDLKVRTPGGEKRVYEHIGDLVSEWGDAVIGECGYSAVGAVVGATYPAQLVELRARLPHVPFLVPGYGAQGGAAADVIGAFDAEGLGAVVNSSRGITQAWEKAEGGEKRYAEIAADAARWMRDEINEALRGRLAALRFVDPEEELQMRDEINKALRG